MHHLAHKPTRATDYRVDPFDLQLFEAVAGLGSITAAAVAMGLSLAAASARLKALEHRVGTQLLDRSKSGSTLTDAGRALSRQARRVLAELDTLHISMSAFGHGLRGTIRLLCNTAAMVEGLAPRLGRFLSAHPDIDVELQEMSSASALRALRDGMADVAIIADHVDTSGLVCKAWMDDELIALLPRAGGRRARASVRFTELLERPFVGLPMEAGLSQFIQAQAARCGRIPHHRVRVAGFETMVSLVEAGAGVAIMPLSAAQRYLSGAATIVRLQEPWALRTLLICHSVRAPSLPGVEALLKELEQFPPG